MTVLIAGGGTGGHVFPMLAVGDAVAATEPSARVVYVGTARGLEVRAIGDKGRELMLLDVAPLRGGGVRGFVEGSARAARSLPAARALVQRLGPDVVLSVGGYASGPVALAARISGVPVSLLEPNSVLGLANRLLAPFTARAFVAYPEAERYLRPSILRRTGVPLRGAFTPSPYAAKEGPLAILVLGGSQGAVALNETVPQAIAAAKRAGVALTVVHQTGKDREETVRARYSALSVSEVTVVPFIDDMAEALARADLVIGRAGASSVAELCAVGRPSILIPYPFAADDHQLKNAESVAKMGAAIVVAHKDATVTRLAVEIERLARSPELRARMARAAEELGRPEAAVRVAEELLEIARQRRAGKEAS